MAGGKPAFGGATAAVIFNSILTNSPTPLSVIRSDVPPELESIICRALAKDRKARYQNAAEMKADLKRLQRELESHTLESTTPSRAVRRKLPAVWIGVVLTLLVFVGVLTWFLAGPRTQNLRVMSHRTTVAVLPFQNTTPDATLDYLGTALPDEVITTLSYAPTLSVRPFSMSQRFTGQNFDPHQAGQELRVTDVVTGHFLRHADRVGVTLEAMDVAKDEVTWRGSVDVDSQRHAYVAKRNDRAVAERTPAVTRRLIHRTLCHQTQEPGVLRTLPAQPG
jgi:TolB-like protein